ncbi:hypothetical protein [Alicyclobacillus ferrooxydans]|uniref:hypothetical protein n=1 Tax=Alicyclobacillus ferrooxydans TaxID=471514 RepID=UPI000B1BCC09|nr:hypothetical protein [Alicyclobacillus ferrooxydans]
MRRYQLQMIALVAMWIGGIEIVASFLVHYWFAFNIPYTPFFFLLLLLGIVTYFLARMV